MNTTFRTLLTHLVLLLAFCARAQLIDVHFTNDSWGSGNGGGPPEGPPMSGAAVLGGSGDQWNNIAVNNGNGIPLMFTDGSASSVQLAVASSGGYDVNSYGGYTQFAGTLLDPLMECYLFAWGGGATIALSGLTSNAAYTVVLYAAADAVAAGRVTQFTINGVTQTSVWDGISSTLIQGVDYVIFTQVASDATGALNISYNGTNSVDINGVEGDINGFQLTETSVSGTGIPGVSLGLYPGITIQGVVGHRYIIQETTDLSDTNSWVTMTTLALQQPVQLWVDTNVDASLPANPRRFYQVLPGP